MQTIEYDHISTQMTYPPAEMRVERIDVRMLSRSIGYVMGAGDKIPEALEQLGASVTLLSDVDLASGSLSRYDAIVCGVRALNTRPGLLAAKDRVLAYVEAGGTLVVQYNTLPFGRGGAGRAAPTLAPYPLTPSRNRVTDETAQVSFPSPDHVLLQAPNKITAADFAGWVQERGLYFMSAWDERYQPIAAANDPGEEPQQGGMLYARYGKGRLRFHRLLVVPPVARGRSRSLPHLRQSGQRGQAPLVGLLACLSCYIPRCVIRYTAKLPSQWPPS